MGRPQTEATKAKLRALWTDEQRSEARAKALGRTHTPETKAKLRAAALARPKPTFSPEHRQRISESLRRAYAEGRKVGHPISDEQRAKMSAALRGRERTPEHRAALSAALKGRVISLEQRAKLSAAGKGRPHTPEHRAAIAAAWTPEKRQRAALALRDAAVIGECVYCGGPATTHDHILPRALPYGGSDHPDNVVPACLSCNTAKGDRDPWAWLEGEPGERLRRVARDEDGRFVGVVDDER